MSSDDGFDALLRAVAESPSIPLTSIAGERFSLVRRLGEGTFGVVYEAEDREQRRHVALKMLRHPHPDWIHRFKREFRALRDLTHPNVVRLDELFCIGGNWFFTMELLHGTSILDHVRNPEHVTDSSTLPATATRLSIDRLRHALSQVADGLAVFHQGGRVHRDIKPSNVLVTRDGRAVILDFGLVTDASGESSSAIVGTPAYMAPEQKAGSPVTPAADIYAVGVLMFEMLTGKRPDGEPFNRNIPGDLTALCAELLADEPSQRPTASDLKRRLRDADAIHTAIAAPRNQSSFVGRTQELAELQRAFVTARRDGGGVCIIHGESGVGKSRTMRHFLEQLRLDGAIVFEGQCHEREEVPYKTIDGVIDSLINYLVALPRPEVSAILPTHTAALVQVFPALLRVPSIDALVARSTSMQLSDVRSRAFREFRDLWTRLALTRPVVIAIDDLQWADRDGLRALADVMRPPEAPPLLLVGTLRIANDDTSALAELSATLECPIRELSLGYLDQGDRRMLATRLANERSLGASELDRIELESGGHPLFVEHLVDLLDVENGDELTLERAIALRTQELAPEHRRLAEVTALSGRPLVLSVAAIAAQIDHDELPASLRALCDRRIGRRDGDRRLDVYHGRVRDAIVAGLSPATRRDLHAKLAAAYESESCGDCEAIARHWHDAGESGRALPFVIQAGDGAADALAFERAAFWYQRALENIGGHDDLVVGLRCKLGDALANAGRGALAASQFSLAAAASPPDTALMLRQREADQLVRNGYLAEGLEATTRVLAMVGITLPRSRVRLVASLLAKRLALAVRGLRFRERLGASVDPDARTRLDVCLMAAYALSFIDPLRGLWLQSLGLLQALKLGEPTRISRALSLELGYLGSYGRPARRKLARLSERARVIAAPSGEAQTLVHAGIGSSLFLNGEFKTALEHTDQAISRLETESPGLVHELVTMRMFSINALAELGRFGELRLRQQAGLRDAQARSDVYARIMFTTGMSCLGWLIDNQPDAATAEAIAAMKVWPSDAVHLEHLYALSGRFLVSTYTRDGLAAATLAREYVTAARNSLFHRIQKIRVAMHYYVGCAALMAASAGDKNGLSVARNSARAIAAERIEWSSGFVAYLRGGISLHRGEHERAVEQLTTAVTAFEDWNMLGYAAAVRERCGRIQGGAANAVARSLSLGFFLDQQAISPERMIDMLAPGLVAC